MDNPVLVFVYGTLKVGGKLAIQLDKYRKAVRKAEIIGDLFNIHGMYPGLKLGGQNTVTGEVHEYTDLPYVLRLMDFIERCDIRLFKRATTEVALENGRIVNAYVYEVNDELIDLKDPKCKKIETGCWQV